MDSVKLFNRYVSIVSKALPQQHRTIWTAAVY